MSPILAIARREVNAYFSTPVGWLALFGFVTITGVFSGASMTYFSIEATRAAASPYGGSLNINQHLIPGIFQNQGVIFLLLCPALSMHLFSSEKRQKSFELLLAAPLTTTQIVLGKYIGALGFLAVLLAGTLHIPGILFWLGNPDPGVLAAGYLSWFLLGGSLLAVGMLASAFTESQVVALVLAFGASLMLWILSWFDQLLEGTKLQAFTSVSMLTHYDKLSQGLLHSGDLVYYLTFIGFMLFATYQRVEATRWQ